MLQVGERDATEQKEEDRQGTQSVVREQSLPEEMAR
tara:strand:+ start:359 stop:466 length:108 start_codon:yes stop_codon:yes gene_type:complete